MKKNKINFWQTIITILAFISIITQINIFIADKIKINLMKEKIKKQQMICSLDYCVLSEYYDVPPYLEPIEEIEVSFE